MKTANRRTKVVLAVVVVGAFAALAGAAGAGPRLGAAGPVANGRSTDVIQVAVELGLTPTAAVYRERLDLHGNKAAATAAAVSQLANVDNEQWSLRSKLSLARIGGVTEIFSLKRTFNAVVYVTTRDKLDALKKIPGVKAVHVMTPLQLTNARSIPFIGAPGIWEGLGSNLHGEGIRLGVIDTGVDYLHTTFGGSGLPADYTANDTLLPAANAQAPLCTGSDDYFPTAKATGGIDLAGALYDVVNSPDILPVPDCDPMDFHGHGTHVAGTATGYGVNGDGTTYAGPWNDTTPFASLSIGPGVAPLASLYPIKIIGDNDVGSSGLVAEAVEHAVDPDGDGDFSDHLDVVNISFGGSFGVENVESMVYRNAVQAGMILCISQGNAYDVYFIGGSPGSTSEVITVAASQHDGTTAPRVVVNSPAGLAGTKVAAGAAFGPALGATGLTADVVVALDNDLDPTYADDPLDGCDPITTDLTGKIALINRGACPFTLKVAYAQLAGAAGVIIANTAAGAMTTLGFTDVGLEITIPSVMITYADGQVMRTTLASEAVNATMLDMVFPAQADNLATFSSRGPTRQGTHAVLKPDISAPGVQIISAAAQSGTLGVAFDGTSMAAPHMTGVMALLVQQHPTWTPAELKALVMNTAAHDVYLNEVDDPRKRIGPGRVGAGRVDLTAATAGSVLAYDLAHPERVSVSFETVDVAGEVREDRFVRLQNKDATQDVTYDITVDTAVSCDGAGVTVEGATQITVPANSVVDVPVALTANAASMIRRRDATVAATMLGAPRYWLAEQSGWFVFTPTSAGAEPTLRVPFYAALNPASEMHAAGPLGVTGATGTANLTLAGTGLDTLLTHPTETYPNAPLSMVTPFELLYASPEEPPLLGEYPAGYDPANTDPADLKYFGVASNLLDKAGVVANSTIYFGIVANGLWGTPREVEFDVYVRRVGASDWEHVILNYDQGLSAANPGQDLMAVYQYNLGTGAFNARAYLNGLPGNNLYVPAFMSDAMVFPIAASRLGLDANNTRIEIAVATWSMSNYFVDLIDTTPVLTYNVAAPGFVAPLDAQLGLPQPYQLDLPDVQLPITYDLNAARANMSGGLLLIHWLNGMGARGEKVDVDGLTCLTDADCITVDKQFCDVLSGICMGCVDNSDCLGGQYCDTYGSRTCISDCTVPPPWANACAPGSYCNIEQFPHLCVADCRWKDAEPCAAGTVCSTASGLCVVVNSLVNVTTIDPTPDAEHCPNGGVMIEVGLDDDNDMVLEPAEVDQTRYVCNGLPSLIVAETVAAGTGPCEFGGQLVHAGIDDNADGTLVETEWDNSWYVCNGIDGLHSVIRITTEEPGAICPNGGKKVEWGIDDDRDQELDDGEVDDFKFVCNGVDGADGKKALVNVTDEAAGDNCAAGGKKVEAGIDANDDGTLQAGEVDTTTYVCNGADGAEGAEGVSGSNTLVENSAVGPGLECANGGQLVRTGIDANGNGFLDPDEVTSTTSVCNGEKGSGCSAASSTGAGPLGLLLLLGLIVLRRRG